MSTATWFSLKGFLRSRRQNLSLVHPSCCRKPKGNFDECRTNNPECGVISKSKLHVHIMGVFSAYNCSWSILTV